MKQNLTRAQRVILKWRQRDTVYKSILALQRQLEHEAKWCAEWEEFKSESDNRYYDSYEENPA